ncbi:MAG: hypothetical protein FWD90_05265 [Defluviitaleaceae bacterium]|nr:hypothetical protein [Defluviitaleaceae bacterium]
MGIWDWAIIAAVVLVVIVAALYFLNRWAGKRMATQNEMVEKHKQTVTIYVIDKKKDKVTNANLPKAMASQIPRMGRMMKMPLVKAKVGKDIMTLMCDNKVFPALPVKKNVTVEMAGIYIVGMKGMKTKSELAASRGKTVSSSGLSGLLARFRR